MWSMESTKGLKINWNEKLNQFNAKKLDLVHWPSEDSTYIPGRKVQYFTALYLSALPKAIHSKNREKKEVGTSKEQLILYIRHLLQQLSRVEKFRINCIC